MGRQGVVGAAEQAEFDSEGVAIADDRACPAGARTRGEPVGACHCHHEIDDLRGQLESAQAAVRPDQSPGLVGVRPRLTDTRPASLGVLNDDRSEAGGVRPLETHTHAGAPINAAWAPSSKIVALCRAPPIPTLRSAGQPRADLRDLIHVM